jgi:hypothetical protein
MDGTPGIFRCSDKSLKMFVCRTSCRHANILFDLTAELLRTLFLSLLPVKLVSPSPVERVVKLGSNQEVLAKGEANVCMRVGCQMCTYAPSVWGRRHPRSAIYDFP